MFIRFIERFKLKYRAAKYKTKNDRGGIVYILDSIKNGQTVFDIGAHKAGYLYYMLAQVGKQGQVVAFEPQSNLYKYISKLKTSFKWDNVSVEHLALSDKNGETTLYIPANKVKKGSSPGASVLADKNSNNCITELVKIETLDSYCLRQNIIPDFLKIDIEGNELNFFRGAVTILQKYKPKIIVEIEARHVGKNKVLETFEFMKSLNYEGCFIHGLNRIPLASFSFEKHQNISDAANYCNNFIFE